MADAARRLFVYADGSCLGNPGPGGWGVVIVEASGVSASFSGGEPSTTNNRMEITAAIEALRAIPPGSAITLRSDSQYLVKTMRLGWKRKQNLDLWEKLDALVARHQVTFEWVEGHAGNPLNEEADQLARKAAMLVAQSGRPQQLGIAKSGSRQRPGSAHAPSGTARSGPTLTIPTPQQQGQPSAPCIAASNADTVADALAPLLATDETMMRCAGCGQTFVGSADAPAPHYCALAACQLAARSCRSSS